MSKLLKAVNEETNNLKQVDKINALAAVLDKHREVSIQEDVILIDLDVQIPKSNKFLYDAIHLNESGSILMGEIVSKKLAEVIQSR